MPTDAQKRASAKFRVNHRATINENMKEYYRINAERIKQRRRERYVRQQKERLNELLSKH